MSCRHIKTHAQYVGCLEYIDTVANHKFVLIYWQVHDLSLLTLQDLSPSKVLPGEVSMW